ncbi:hypothetical protein PsorP6_006161 [Peronosclerospora sorghi]|uniref:Uncharacterized protein n=1 Tax=Peronosclerospora sorghi TaxID=230839 RepID=A0ACC0W2J5_9STRA|nr:hypothetical protein PsorP6_006161 [Peronosclerospora sorghi]
MIQWSITYKRLSSTYAERHCNVASELCSHVCRFAIVEKFPRNMFCSSQTDGMGGTRVSY